LAHNNNVTGGCYILERKGFVMICNKCGNSGGTGKFCIKCGAALGVEKPKQEGGISSSAPQPERAQMSRMRKADEVEYKIHGDDLQFVEIMLDPGETIIAEAGAMMYMDSAIKMETIFGDGSGKEGNDFMGKLFSAGKRVITGESLFMTAFTNTAGAKRYVSFAAPYPGKVIPFDLGDYGGTMICQKDAFLCAAKGVSVGIAFQKKLGVGLFGGEGFIMEKLEGDGLTFMHAGGTIIKKDLQLNETIKLDTGCLVAMTKTINYDIQFANNIKTALFGGEGLALATLSGPGSVWLQSLPFSRLADRIYSAGKGGSKRKEEGSILGNIGIGTFFGGDD
jgi:uncharacterized protein (TIGR00266 family)